MPPTSSLTRRTAPQAATIIKEGDEVIVYGKVVNYKGNTPQFAQGSYITSLNGQTK